MVEDNTFIVEGRTPLVDLVTDVSIGQVYFDNLSSNQTDKEALVDALTGRSITYKEIFEKTCLLAQSLQNAGYTENSMFAICSENCVEYFVPIITSLYIGTPIASLNPTYTGPELLHTLDVAKPKVIFVSRNVAEKINNLKQRLKFIEKIIIIDSTVDINNIECLNQFIATNIKGKTVKDFQLSNFDPLTQVAFLLFSSGTTGLPKGVMITHSNIFSKFLSAMDPRIMRTTETTSTIGLLPFYHAYGLFIGLGSISRQVKIIVLQRFEEQLFLKTIEKYKVTSLVVVPPIALFLAKSPLVEKYDLSHVEEIGCGAAPLSKNTQDLLKKRFKIKTVRQGYGLTETTLGVAVQDLDDHTSGSVGKLYPYVQAKVRDPETKKSLPPYQVGELCFKGPEIMKGYYNNEEATKNAFTSDGWLLTGDLGYYDEEKKFYIVGRIKELIKYKGYQVPPAELEAILITHPQIQDAAVVGLPNEEAGELPLAFVVKNKNATVTEAEIKKFLSDKVSPPKRLRGGVIFINEIPKNPSGKILRRQLNELLKTHVKAKL